MARALVTGITGQDGSYLAELLLDQGYEVLGVARQITGPAVGNLEAIADQLELRSADVSAPGVMAGLVDELEAEEIYHLAAPTYVPDSWRAPSETLQAIAGSTGELLAASAQREGAIRVYVAGSGEMFGAAPTSPQDEATACRPTNPYAVSKLAAHGLVGALREHSGLYACSGITYNHESPRRPKQFVTRRVTRGAAAIKLGLAQELTLGDLGAVRDWSHARDIVRGAHLMLQASEADDYVLASGVGRTVQDLVDTAFACVDLDPADFVRTDPGLSRGVEEVPRVGDASKAHKRLGWVPEISFEGMIEEMVQADLSDLRSD